METYTLDIIVDIDDILTDVINDNVDIDDILIDILDEFIG